MTLRIGIKSCCFRQVVVGWSRSVSEQVSLDLVGLWLCHGGPVVDHLSCGTLLDEEVTICVLLRGGREGVGVVGGDRGDGRDRGQGCKGG